MNRFLTLVLAAFVFASSAFCQNATGTIEGRVTDASGAAIPGAAVTVENQSTNVKLTQQTNSEGRFYQRYLATGKYNVTVQKTGFQKYVQTQLQLDVEQTVSLVIPMKVGEVTSTIEVQASAAQLSTESATVSTAIGTKQILDLPLGGNRNVLSLASLVPGVVSGGGSTPWISGGRNDYNDVTIDGTSVIVPENNVSHLQVGYTPLEDSVAEFSVVTNSLAPEYGRTGGGSINIATRTGANKINLDLFEFFRNNVLNANSWGNIRNGLPRGIVRYNQFGGTLGGPVVIPHVYNGKNKTFFFVSEQSVRTPSSTAPTASVPIDKWRNGDFSGFTNGASGGVGAAVTIYDPATVGTDASCPATQPRCFRQPFAGNQIPASRVDPVAKKLLTYWPTPNNPGGVTNQALQTNNWRTQGVANNPVDQLDARIDHNFSEKLRVFARGSNQTGVSTDFNAFGNPGTPSGSGPNNYYNRNITANAIYTLTPTTILNFNYGFARAVALRYPFSQGTKPSSIGLPSNLDGLVDNFEFPQISISGNNTSYSLGQASFTTLLNRPMSHVLRSDVTKIMGKHTLKAGFTYEKLLVNFTQLGSPDGQFSFGSGYTQQNASAGSSTTQGLGMATFLLGLPSNNGNDIQFTYSAATSSAYMGAYMQDDFKVTSKLTVNLGVRWDVDIPRTERYNRLSYFDLNAPSPLQGRVAASAICPNCGKLVGAMRFVGTSDSLYGRHQVPTNWNDWAPRIGFAWNVMPKMVIRGAYGILYAPSVFQAAGTSGTSGTEGFTGGTALNTSVDNGTTFIASLSNPFPSGIVKPLGAQNGPISGTLTDIGGGVQDSFFNDTHNPIIQQWNFTTQREVKGGWIIQAGYLGSKGQHLPDGESSITYNQLPASFLSLGTALNANVANPFYGIIQNPTSIYAQPTIAASRLLDAYPQYSGVSSFRKPGANSIYHAFILSAEHRFSHGLSTLVSFTGGKLLDDASQVVTFVGQAGSKQDYYCRKCEKSVSSQDVPRRLVANANWEIPFGKGRMFLGSIPKAADFIIGGWQINGITTFQRGIPLAIGNGGNSSGLNSPGIRATDNGTNPAKSGAIAGRLTSYFDQTAFSQTPNFKFGNVGRFLPNVRGPGTHNVDFSIFKNFHPMEKVMVQFRAEMFNATNSITWGGPGTTVNAPATFGIITSASGNRTMQLGLKLYY